MLKNNRLIIAITGAALLIIVITTAIFYNSITGLQKQIKDNQATISNLNSKLENLSSSSSPQASLDQSRNSNVSSSSSESSSKAVLVNLKVFFSKNPESNNNFSFTQVATRTTDRKDTAAFVIEQLIAGPTADESAAGLATPLRLSGNSNCGEKDFSLDITSKVATLRFCKQIVANGIGDDGRIKSVITETLKQFTNIEIVIILTKDNLCFGDLSGLDICKS
jgi:hypothetical protein